MKTVKLPFCPLGPGIRDGFIWTMDLGSRVPDPQPLFLRAERQFFLHPTEMFLGRLELSKYFKTCSVCISFLNILQKSNKLLQIHIWATDIKHHNI